jgi:hypothetical protein
VAAFMFVIVINYYVSRLFEFVISFTYLPTGGSALDRAKNMRINHLNFISQLQKLNYIIKYGINTFHKFISYGCASFVVLMLID